MKADTTIRLDLEPGETWDYEDRDGNGVHTRRVTTVVYSVGSSEAVIYAVRVYKSGQRASNGMPKHIRLADLPEHVLRELRAEAAGAASRGARALYAATEEVKA